MTILIIIFFLDLLMHIFILKVRYLFHLNSPELQSFMEQLQR